MTPSVFDIPGGTGALHDVSIEGAQELPPLHARFYRVDEAVLQEAAVRAWNRAADITLGQTEAVMHVAGHAGEQLFTSLPWDRGWQAVQNGREVTPGETGGAWMSFVLDEGENEIRLQYVLPGGKQGVAISVVSLLACAILWRRERRTWKERNSRI